VAPKAIESSIVEARLRVTRKLSFETPFCLAAEFRQAASLGRRADAPSNVHFARAVGLISCINKRAVVLCRNPIRPPRQAFRLAARQKSNLVSLARLPHHLPNKFFFKGKCLSQSMICSSGLRAHRLIVHRRPQAV
jgi:hypothetical protein